MNYQIVEKLTIMIYVFCVFSDAFMINLALVLGFTAYITLYPFQWLEDLLEVCSQTISRDSKITSVTSVSILSCGN